MISVRVRLLAFASAADIVGSERTLEISAGATVSDLREQLAREFPALAALWPRIAIAVDGAVAGASQPLHDGCEVALLPPVSGG